MALKFFKAVWFLSVLLLLATLLYGYASWQEVIQIHEDGGTPITIDREILFYGLAITFAVVNVMVYIVSKMYPGNEDLRAWFHGLLITINLFFIIAMSLVGVYNSAEKYDFSRIGFIVYGSVGLIILWALAWPVYLLYQKFFLKSVV
jgi:hypothetical protein